MSDQRKDYITDMDKFMHYNKNLGFDMDEHGWTEEITEENFYVPTEAEYEDLGEETEEWNWAADRPGLWENIRKKKEREGKNYKPAKTVKQGRPTQEQLKKSQSKHKYKDPKTGQVYEYEQRGVYKKDGRTLIPTKAEIDYTESAEYQGRKVQLGKPFKTPGGPKKSAVYVKNGSGKVVIVRFGDPNMKIKKNIPGRRKNFRARHNCSNPGPRWKARYWSCKAW
jgi:hypothetical protein